MRLHIISDLHTEFKPFDIPKIDADVLILGGDIVNADGINKLDEMVSHIDIPVLMVAGNHEYYGGDMVEVDKKLASSSVVFLQNETTVIDGVRFIGSTLWTDYLLNGPGSEYGAMLSHENNLNDFGHIEFEGKRLDAYKVRDINGQSKKYLRAELMESFDGPTVVITHMAPSSRSIHPAYENSTSLNPLFVCDCEHYIGPWVDLWVHGHTHSSFDYKLGKTRIICNPRGYPGTFGDMGNDFNPNLIVEIPDLSPENAIG